LRHPYGSFYVGRVTRSLCAATAIAVLALAAPAQAAKPTFSVKAPAAGDMSLAHVVFETKGGTGTPKLTLTNRSKLSPRLTVAGGVLKLKKNRYLASVAVLLKTGGGGGTPAFKLVPPKGMSFSKFTAQLVGKNLLSNTAAPKFCSAAPKSFGYVAKKLLAGTFVDRFPSAQEYVIAGYRLNCPAGGYEDRANLAAALRGEPDPGAGGAPGSGGGAGEEEEETPEGGGTTNSTTLQGSGTVFAEGSNVFRYEISFNEPVHAYDIAVSGTSIACPNQYDEAACGSLGNHASGGGTNLDCRGGEYSFEFSCATPRSGATRDRTPPPAVPANTTITGRFTINAGSVAPGKVKLTGYSASGKGQPATLSGP
jgi:hypothetical protein